MNEVVCSRIFEHSNVGISYHRMIFSEGGEPLDYEFVEVNPAFGEVTGLS